MQTPPTPLDADALAFQAVLAGRYSIERELGRGGMGIVYLAREVALDRLVALKLLPPEMAAKPGVKERFLKEARTAARLSQPNIVQIYSVDEVKGFVFFAMAYVDGGTLGDRIRQRGPLSNSEAIRLLREVSWALGYAHLQGVVHRDVKPDNILLDQSGGRALVTDFGIAVVAEDVDPTAAREVVGTAEFMSPEQAKGGVVDARSDLYSLGCVGFYALTGRMPFTGDTASVVLAQHVATAPPTLLSVAPHAPPAVAAALDRCLRKEPDTRWESGETLAEAMRPEHESDRELPVPLRVFIKESREFETVVAYSGLGLAFALPAWLLALLDTGGAELGVKLALTAAVGALTALPLANLARTARRLLEAGFTRADGTVAFLRDIERKEEEFRFQVGDRKTPLDSILGLVKSAGLAGLTFGSVAAVVGGLTPLVPIWSFIAASGAALWHEIRARVRGDVMGERYLRLWKGKLGNALFRVGGAGLKRIAPAGAGMHRATEIVIGLAADRLFEELPRDMQKLLPGLPDTVRALEDDAQAMRKQVEEMDAVLAEIGDDDPASPHADERRRVRASVEATRNEAREKLQSAVAALESVRLGLLYMQAGTGTVESLTMELEAAQDLSEAMDNLLAGHREVEEILHERRRTGYFSLVTADTAG